MNAESSVKLIEEMIDLKLQQHAQANLKASPETTRILEESGSPTGTMFNRHGQPYELGFVRRPVPAQAGP